MHDVQNIFSNRKYHGNEMQKWIQYGSRRCESRESVVTINWYSAVRNNSLINCWLSLWDKQFNSWTEYLMEESQEVFHALGSHRTTINHSLRLDLRFYDDNEKNEGKEVKRCCWTLLNRFWNKKSISRIFHYSSVFNSPLGHFARKRLMKWQKWFDETPYFWLLLLVVSHFKNQI